MEYREFADSIVEEFNLIQEQFRTRYKIDDYANWYYDQATELLTLSTNDQEINFKYTPIGTYSNKTGTWMWAWENADSIEKTKGDTLKIKEFGLANR